MANVLCRIVLGASGNPFRSQDGGLNITDVDREDFNSIDIRDKGLTPTCSQEKDLRCPREASFIDRILRVGSGAMASDSLVSVPPT